MLSSHIVYSLPRQIPADAARVAQARAIVESAIAAAFAVPVHELRMASRGAAPIAFARQSAMYLAHVVLGLSYSDVGRTFGRDRTTAAYACRLVEERREDPWIDATLGALEQALLPNRMGESRVAQP
jgi:chromosomal replication initiation ATPase DnaA